MYCIMYIHLPSTKKGNESPDILSNPKKPSAPSLLGPTSLVSSALGGFPKYMASLNMKNSWNDWWCKINSLVTICDIPWLLRTVVGSSQNPPNGCLLQHTSQGQHRTDSLLTWNSSANMGSKWNSNLVGSFGSKQGVNKEIKGWMKHGPTTWDQSLLHPLTDPSAIL